VRALWVKRATSPARWLSQVYPPRVDPSSANIVAKVIVFGFLALLAGFVAKILLGVRAGIRRNRDFLSSAIVARELTPGAELSATFSPVAGSSHAVWLDLSLSGPEELPFELRLSLRVGDKVIVDDSYAVRFDDEGDVRGLPGGSGVTALNTSGRSGLGRAHTNTVLRICPFHAPTAAAAEVRARLVPGEGVTVKRARLLVTERDAPPT
jgi:hypothetical protein